MKVGNRMENKELFIALLGNKDLALPRELENNISLFTNKVDLDYIEDVLYHRNPKNDEPLAEEGETLVGAIVTRQRILTIVHRNRPTNYQGSNGYIGSSFHRHENGYIEEEGYAWTKEYELDQNLANTLEKVFGRPAFFS